MKSIFTFLPLLFGLTLGVVESLACSCLPPPTVLDECTKSDIVMIARFDGLEEVRRGVEGTNVYRTYNARLIVEKVYKGNLSVGEEIRVRSGHGGDCTYYFEGEPLGRQFLVFTRDPRLSDKSRSVEERSKTVVFPFSICSRSRILDHAKPDLSYLDNRKAKEGQTRLTSTIRPGGEAKANVSGIEVTIKGNGQERRVRTDEDGFFEVWNLRAGEYELDYKLPAGWKIGGHRILPWSDREYRGRASVAENPLKVHMAPRKHTEVTVVVTIDNQISGKVIGPDGAPMKGVCVSAYWLTPKTDSFMIPRNCTNEEGNFTITELPPGNYRLDVNSTGLITAEQPFETFYYPNASRKKDAQVISIGEGTRIRDLIIKVEKVMPLITISGRLTSRDGRPFPEQEIIFKPDDDSRFDRVEVESDAEGRFTLKVAEGASGWLEAKVSLFEMRFSQCSEAKKLRGNKTGRDADVNAAVKIDGKTSKEVELKLAIPYCKPID